MPGHDIEPLGRAWPVGDRAAAMILLAAATGAAEVAGPPDLRGTATRKDSWKQ